MRPTFGQEQDTPTQGMIHDALHGQLVEIENKVQIPQLVLQLNSDASDGYNLRLIVRNFKLESPIDASSPTDLVRGHAHVYLNNTKLLRLYGPDLHLPERLFSEGINTLQVTLNAHNHSRYAIAGSPLEATILMDPTRENWLLSHFSTSDIKL